MAALSAPFGAPVPKRFTGAVPPPCWTANAWARHVVSAEYGRRSIGGAAIALHEMDVRRHCGVGHRVAFLRRPLAQNVGAVEMHRHAAAQIRQGKGRLAVAAIVVPSRRNRPWFWLICMIWPLHIAQLGGRKQRP